MNQISSKQLWTALILLTSMLGVALMTWFVPSLSAASTNALFRLRGELNVADDIVIVAIDDLSLQQVGRWPWPRSVMADALDKISAARPRAVGLDVIYAEPSVDDNRLAQAVRNNGRVVLPAQLIGNGGEESSRSGTVTWLYPVMGDVATVGHAHVSPDVDGILRAIQLSKADDEGTRLWAFSLEVVRVAEGLSSKDFEERPGLLHFGSYEIDLREKEPVGSSEVPGVQLNRSNEMLINYAGPAASFPRYSIARLLDGQIPSDAFTDKIVLIGAVATSMSDVGVSPFMNYDSDEPHAGQEMPGVEVHANIINTIRQRVWLRTVPEIHSFLLALAVIILTALVISRFDSWRQIAGLGLIFLTILLGSFLAFKYLLLIPPVPAMLFGFAAAIPLMLNRTLNASRRLDVKLEALARTQKGFLLDERNGSPSASESSAWLDLPHNLAWKLRAVDDITTRLLARMNFMDRVLSGMGEGVMVADTSGRVVFANQEAAQVFTTLPQELLFTSFSDTFVARGIFNDAELREALREASVGKIFQKEFTLQTAEVRTHYALQLSAIMAHDNSDSMPTGQLSSDCEAISSGTGRVIGLLALITDTTRRVELDQIRIETLQLVSHELRTPLTSIQGLSDVLLKFPVETTQAREMLATIHAEAVRLSATINRYLDISRLESGAQPLRITMVDLEQLVADCVRMHAPLAAERGIMITQKFSIGDRRLAADAQLLSQAINNLLSNAIKYGSMNSAVTIEIRGDQAMVLIEVRDQGAGIPAQECGRLFEKFYRLERDAASAVVGTGLGLPLVKEIVEKHGGRVQVESTTGVGSTFSIQLPLEPHAP